MHYRRKTTRLIWGLHKQHKTFIIAIDVPKRVISSAEERFPHTEEVTGSNPVPPTIKILTRSAFAEASFLFIGKIANRTLADLISAGAYYVTAFSSAQGCLTWFFDAFLYSYGINCVRSQNYTFRSSITSLAHFVLPVFLQLLPV